MQKRGLLNSNCETCKHWVGFHEDKTCSFCDEIVSKPVAQTMYYFKVEGFCGRDNLRYLEHKIAEESIKELRR